MFNILNIADDGSFFCYYIIRINLSNLLRRTSGYIAAGDRLALRVGISEALLINIYKMPLMSVAVDILNLIKYKNNVFTYTSSNYRHFNIIYNAR